MSLVKASDMEDPNLIATFIPVDDEKRAENAFCLDKNKKRYLPPTRGIAEGPTISSREATPAREQPDDDHCKYDSTHRLQLTFGKAPMDASRGYSFGTDPNNCDVLLGNRGAYGISGLHFWITFADTIDKKKTHLILKDSSTNGTAVGYSGQAIMEVRRHFTWILDLEKDEGKWEIMVNAQELRFKVELASHKTCKADYDKKVKEFLEQSSTALPPVDGLGIDSYTTTAQPSQASTPRQLPVYISERELGRGSFGRVDRVVDVSTGATYARKEFYEPQWGKNKERRRQQEEHWLDQVRREIRIMRENSHENIVQVVASRDGPLPFLVMPYLSLGNLEDLNSESPITAEETLTVLFQALNALRHLHLRGVAHRDLKPENILVEARFPLSIKLADFGLANDKADLETLCGTQVYTAPEVYLRGKYTASVDLWSLGVIIFQYVYGLPQANRQKRGQHKRSTMEEWGLTWCRRVVAEANDWDSDDLINLITTGMLRMRPEERLSADACLAEGYDRGLFHGHSRDSGSATPTQQKTLQGESKNDDGSTTVLLSTLWDTEEMSKHDGNNRTGCSKPDHASGILESCSFPRPGSPSGSQLGRFGSAFDGLDSKGRSSADISYPLKAGLTFPGGLKRQRSPVVGSPANSSSRGRTKRRPSGVRVTEVPVARELGISDRHSGSDGELNQICTIYDAVLARLNDLLGSKSQKYRQWHQHADWRAKRVFRLSGITGTNRNYRH